MQKLQNFQLKTQSMEPSLACVMHSHQLVLLQLLSFFNWKRLPISRSHLSVFSFGRNSWGVTFSKPNNIFSSFIYYLYLKWKVLFLFCLVFESKGTLKNLNKDKLHQLSKNIVEGGFKVVSMKITRTDEEKAEFGVKVLFWYF